MDPDSVLAYLQNKDIINQARGLNKNLLSLPQPPNTGSTFKDFLLNALQTAPMAMGAKAPNPIIGGIRPPNLKTNLGVTQPSGAGIAENANVYNPKVNDVLGFLSKENINVPKVQDAKSGTSYIYAENPHAQGDRIKIRVPNDEHVAGFERTRGLHPSNFFDLGTKRTGAGNPKIYNRNESGEMYGKNPDALENAIKYRFSTDLTPPGTEYTPPKVKTPAETPKHYDPNQLDFNLETQKLHDLINQVSGKGMPGEPNPYPYNVPDASINAQNMEKPQLTTNEMKDMSQTIDEVLSKFRMKPFAVK